MKEKLKSLNFLIKLLKTFNVLFIVGMCWLFADSMISCFANAPVKATLYAIIGGLYIGSYGAMTSSMWIDYLSENDDKQ